MKEGTMNAVELVCNKIKAKKKEQLYLCELFDTLIYKDNSDEEYKAAVSAGLVQRFGPCKARDNAVKYIENTPVATLRELESSFNKAKCDYVNFLYGKADTAK